MRILLCPLDRRVTMASADLDVSGQTQSRATSSRVESAVSSRGGSSFILHPFGFHAKTSYDATDALINTRSATFVFKSPPKEEDIWKRPPPDFRPLCYEPRPPPRNSRDAMQPWRYGTLPGDSNNNKPLTRHSAPVRLPDILQDKPPEEPDEFVTAFKIPGPWEAKVLCAKVGVFKPEKYRMPKHHDFRGVSCVFKVIYVSYGLKTFYTRGALKLSCMLIGPC
jgi:hypothetical protein